MPTLYIHPRKGLFQLTRCQDCGHNFQCQNCDANLVTYRTSPYKLELVCHQCQTFYNYPSKCPSCHGQNFSSIFAGIDELINTLDKLSESKTYNFGGKSPAPNWLKKLNKFEPSSAEHFKSSKKQDDNNESENTPLPNGVIDEDNIEFLQKQDGFVIQITENKRKSNILSDTLEALVQPENAVSIRVYDPQIDYSVFNKIVLVQADNLLASPDYLVQEDVHKQLAEVLNQVSPTCHIYFDTTSPENIFFKEVLRLNTIHPQHQDIFTWYNTFIEEEKRLREKFKFPPFYNLLLITSQEKDKSNALTILQDLKNYISTIKAELPEIEVGSPYPARFLRRKNLYSYHILIRYPKGYTKFSILRQTIGALALQKRLQVRLNPKHLF